MFKVVKFCLFLICVLALNFSFSQPPVNISSISQSLFSSEQVSYYKDYAFSNKSTTYIRSGDMQNFKNNSERVFLDMSSIDYFSSKIAEFEHVKVVRFEISSSSDFVKLRDFDFSLLANLNHLDFLFFLFEYDIDYLQAEELINSLGINLHSKLFYQISISN